MARADTDLLDCLAASLAVLLAWHGATEVRTPFAARWRLRLRADDTGSAAAGCQGWVCRIRG